MLLALSENKLRKHPSSRSDLHPHDPLLSEFFCELLAVKKELDCREESLSAAIIGLAAGTADPDKVSPSAAFRLRNLLADDKFLTSVPFLLERLNTRVDGLELPRRGRRRNLDRGELDTFYTPIDLAKWVASLTTKKACSPIIDQATSARQDGSRVLLLHDLSVIRVADFSCGSGILLREGAEWIADAYAAIYRGLSENAVNALPERFVFLKHGLFRLQCITTNVYGVDINEKSVQAAKLVLLLWAASELRAYPHFLPVALISPYRLERKAR